MTEPKRMGRPPNGAGGKWTKLVIYLREDQLSRVKARWPMDGEASQECRALILDAIGTTQSAD